MHTYLPTYLYSLWEHEKWHSKLPSWRGEDFMRTNVFFSSSHKIWIKIDLWDNFIIPCYFRSIFWQIILYEEGTFNARYPSAGEDVKKRFFRLKKPLSWRTKVVNGLIYISSLSNKLSPVNPSTHEQRKYLRKSCQIFLLGVLYLLMCTINVASIAVG